MYLSIFKFASVEYHIYPEYLDTLIPCHTCPKFWTISFCYLLICLKNARLAVVSVDPDQMPQNAASDLGLD